MKNRKRPLPQEQPIEQRRYAPGREPGNCDQCGKEDNLWRVVHQQEGGKEERLCDVCFRAYVSPTFYHAIRAARVNQGGEPPDLPTAHSKQQLELEKHP